MPASANANKMRLLVRFLLPFVLSVAVSAAFAAPPTEEAKILHAEIVLEDDYYVLNADIDLTLKSRVVDTIKHGVSLHFVAELIIEQPRWYWFNAKIVEKTLDYRLYYHPITRTYRLSIGNLHQSFDNLETAVRTMLRIRHWEIDPAQHFPQGIPLEASLRFRLDTAQLPRPFQATLIGSKDWNLATEWLKWNFLPDPVSQ